jgi:hypothetical protein
MLSIAYYMTIDMVIKALAAPPSRPNLSADLRTMGMQAIVRPIWLTLKGALRRRRNRKYYPP